MGLVDELVDSRGALPWAARKAVLRKRKSKPAGFVKSAARHVAGARRCSPSACATRRRQEGARGPLSGALPAHRPVRALRRQRRGDEGRRDARLRAADGVGQSRNLRRVFWLSELLKGQAPKKLGWQSAARARHRRRHHGRRHRRLVRRLRHGGDAAGRLGRADRQGHRRAGQAVCAQVQDQGASAMPPRRASSPIPRATAFARADVVIEAIVENLEIKQKVLRRRRGQDEAGRRAGDQHVLAADRGHRRRPARSRPPHRPALLQSGGADAAGRGGARRRKRATTTCKRGAAFVAAIDKFPLITKSVPGFLVNRVLTPYMFGAMQRLRGRRGQGAHRRSGAHVRHADGARSSWPIRSASMCARTWRRILKFSSDGSQARPARRRRQARQEDRAKASTCGRTASRRRPAAPSTRRRWTGSAASWSSR